MRSFDPEDLGNLAVNEQGQFVLTRGRRGRVQGYILVPVGEAPRSNSGCFALILGILLLVIVASAVPSAGSQGLNGTFERATSGALRGIAQPQPTPTTIVPSPETRATELIRAIGEARGSGRAPLSDLMSGPLLEFERGYTTNLVALSRGERWKAVTVRIDAVRLTGANPFVCATVTWEVTELGANGQVLSSAQFSEYERYSLEFDGVRLKAREVRYYEQPCRA